MFGELKIDSAFFLFFFFLVNGSEWMVEHFRILRTRCVVDWNQHLAFIEKNTLAYLPS